VYFSDLLSTLLETKVGTFLTDSRIFSENNQPIPIGTHIFILNQLHKKYLINNICVVAGENLIKGVKSGRKEFLFQLPE
jgi:hypothetical protein